MLENITPQEPIIIKKIGSYVLKKDVRKILHLTYYRFQKLFPKASTDKSALIHEDIFEDCMYSIKRTIRYI
jgi:hypothetical protein